MHKVIVPVRLLSMKEDPLHSGSEIVHFQISCKLINARTGLAVANAAELPL